MKKIKVLMMSLFAFAMTVSLPSCTSIVEGMMGIEEYCMVLDKVETNLQNAETGENLKEQFYRELIIENGEEEDGIKYISFKDKDVNNAIDVFNNWCKVTKNSLQGIYGKNLPKGGYVAYTFSLRSGSFDGDVIANCTSTIRILGEK